MRDKDNGTFSEWLQQPGRVMLTTAVQLQAMHIFLRSQSQLVVHLYLEEAGASVGENPSNGAVPTALQKHRRCSGGSNRMTVPA